MTRPVCPVCGSPVNTAGESRCWRHRGAKPARVRPRKDPVTSIVVSSVRARDRGCVAARAGFPDGLPCDGPLELDHVINGGMALRGPSVAGNLVTLCRRHHRYKTEHARVARGLLVAYLGTVRNRPSDPSGSR